MTHIRWKTCTPSFLVKSTLKSGFSLRGRRSKGKGNRRRSGGSMGGAGDPPTPYFRSNRGPSPFFHLPDLWRLLVFLLPLVHSLVCCLCYPTVVCSVIICSLLSQLPGNTNLSQKLRYLSSTCDVRKRRSVHEQSQEWTSVGRKKHNFLRPSQLYTSL